MAPATLDERTLTLSPEEAARRVGLEASTLANYRWSGRGPRYLKLGRTIRYRLVDIERWLDEQTRSSTSDTGRAHA